MIRTSINSQIWVCESLSHPAHLVNWKRSTTFLHLKAKVLVSHAQTHQYWELCAWMDLTSFLIRSGFSTIKHWAPSFIPKSMVSMGKSSVLIPWQQTKSSIWVKNSKAALANKPETCRWTQPCILQHRPQLLFTRDNNSSTNGLHFFFFFGLYDLLIVCRYVLMTGGHLEIDYFNCLTTFWLLVRSHIHLMVPNGLFVLLLFSGLHYLYRQTFLLQCKKWVLFMALCHMKHISSKQTSLIRWQGPKRGQMCFLTQFLLLWRFIHHYSGEEWQCWSRHHFDQM